jgi:hypothetical protein
VKEPSRHRTNEADIYPEAIMARPNSILPCP